MILFLPRVTTGELWANLSSHVGPQTAMWRHRTPRHEVVLGKLQQSSILFWWFLLTLPIQQRLPLPKLVPVVSNFLHLWLSQTDWNWVTKNWQRLNWSKMDEIHGAWPKAVTESRWEHGQSHWHCPRTTTRPEMITLIKNLYNSHQTIINVCKWRDHRHYHVEALELNKEFLPENPLRPDVLCNLDQQCAY